VVQESHAEGNEADMTLKRILQKSTPSPWPGPVRGARWRGRGTGQCPGADAEKTVQTAVAAAGQRLPLEVPAGQVVQLRITGENVHLDLRDAQGRHLRRLAENGRGVQTAMWRTQGAQHEQLWATPAQAGQPATVGLQVLQTWTSEGPAPLSAADTPMGPQLQALQQAVAGGAGTEAFWQTVQQQGAPLVEPWQDGQLLVTFVWRDRGNTNVRLFGSPSGDHNPLQKLAGSDVWWTSVVMDPRARLSYGLAPDVPQIADARQQRRMILATLQRDPLNPAVFPTAPWGGLDDIHQGRSVLSLPQAPAQPWVAARAGVPRSC
jgi:enterochelin esterase family protein